MYTLYTPAATGARCFPATISTIYRLALRQFQVGFRGPAEGGQVVADDHGVDAAQDASLGAEVTQGDLAATGEPQHGAR
ncbi:Uncharacterised protein [Mycobacterium tuberculosis]|nr:Uncharacterised protein [Mycobacterium tuberculosis]